VLRAVAALAAERQFGIGAQGIEEGLHRLRLAGGGKGRLPAVALAEPDRLHPRHAARADRVNRRHLGAAAVADQFFRPCRLDFGLCLRNALLDATALFRLPHDFPLNWQRPRA